MKGDDNSIASFVLHEVESLSKGLKEVYRTLQTGGHLFYLEWEKKGPPLNHRIHSKDMEAAMREAGFSVIDRLSPSDFHYVLIARK